MRPGVTMPPSARERLVTSSSKAMVLGRSSSAPASMRVMSSRLVTSRARRSDCNSMSSRSSARSSEPRLGVDLAQARDGCLDGGERRPQVVRRGAHEGAAPAVDLLEQPRPQRLLAQLRPVDGERRLIGERAEQAPVPLGQLHVLEHEHAHGPVAHDQGDRDPAGPPVVNQPERAGLTAPRRHGGHVPFRQGLARRGGDAQHVAPYRSPPTRRPAAREPSSAARRRPARCRRCGSAAATG